MAAATASAPSMETPLKKSKNGALPITPVAESGNVVEFSKDETDSTVSITVVGASGDLAKKKIFPALFALYYEDCFPKVSFSLISMLANFSFEEVNDIEQRSVLLLAP